MDFFEVFVCAWFFFGFFPKDLRLCSGVELAPELMMEYTEYTVEIFQDATIFEVRSVFTNCQHVRLHINPNSGSDLESEC